jgi:catalase
VTDPAHVVRNRKLPDHAARAAFQGHSSAPGLGHLLASLGVIGALAVGAAHPAHAAAPQAAEPTGRQMTQALYSAFGDNHSRAVHAKGVLASGYFTPSPEATSLTKAVLFTGGRKPVLARFSNFTGIPTIPDTVGDANPRGMALKFDLPDGATSDVVTHSFNGFPTKTSEEFRELLLAIGQSGPGAVKPTALDTFLDGHPVAKTFLTTQKPAPRSYTSLDYFGVNAFAFTNAKGKKIFVRYRFVPVAGEAFLSPQALAAMGPDYLQQELPRQLAKGPVAFTWYAQIAEAGDAIDNPSVAWPETRRLVKLGVITLDHVTPGADKVDQATMFTPLNVPSGIEPADPMLGVRKAAYPLSFGHRQ